MKLTNCKRAGIITLQFIIHVVYLRMSVCAPVQKNSKRERERDPFNGPLSRTTQAGKPVPERYNQSGFY